MSGQLNYPKAIESCAPGAGRTIFDGPGQHVDVNPSSIRLLSDRVLLLDLPQDDSINGSLVIPGTAQNGGVGGNFRVGLVIAVGPGDAYIEMGADNHGRVRRKLITAPCPDCDGMGYFPCEDGSRLPCSVVAESDCEDTGRVPVVVPAQCNPGDRVIYDRRREAEVIIEGKRYGMIHAEQSVLAVLED